MKIVILCTPLEAGGAQRAAIRLASEFRKKGFSCENWFLYKKRDIFLDTPFLRLLLERNVKSGWDYVKTIYKLYKNLKRERPDVLITFTHYANIIGQLVALFCGVKVRVASHRNISSGDMSKLLILLDTFNARARVYTAITAVSESTKRSFNFYPKRIFDKIKVIHNGLNFNTPEVPKSDCRRKFGLPVNTKIIGTIGRLSLQKNQRILLEAIADLDYVHLAIIGEGELRSELEAKAREMNINDRVSFLGEVSYNDIPYFLKALDVYVMPSLYEGLSNALVEALNAGLPVISSDVESQRDVIQFPDGRQAGLLLPVHDINAWRSGISKILSDRELNDNLSMKSLERAKAFSMDNMVQGFVECITF